MRLLRFLIFIVLTSAVAALCLCLRVLPQKKQHRAAALLISKFSKALLKIFGFDVIERRDVDDKQNRNHIIVANHLSYLDVAVLLSRGPCLFLGKKEIESWPLIGSIAKSAGIIFVDRDKLWSRASALLEIQERIQDGFNVVIFPEGSTSTTGPVRGLVPFYRGAFRIARMEEKAIETIFIEYENEDRCVWLGDESFAPHLWKLLKCPGGAVKLRSRWTFNIECRNSQRTAGETSLNWLLDGGRSLTYY